MKKRKIAVLIGLFACALLALALAACAGEEHQHTFAEGWQSDTTHHWHEATCEHSEETEGKAEHTWDSGTVTTAATCTEGGVMTYTCTVCSATKTEVIAATGHRYAEEWTPDKTHHWHEATCGHDVVSGRNAHLYEAGVCRICGAPQPVTEGLTFNLINDGKEYEVGLSNINYTSVLIPDTHNGLPVTRIGDNAFYDKSNLRSVTIPDSVTSIGSSAFSACKNLTSVTLGNGVTTIGNYAFYNCSGLEEVHITDLAAWCAIEFDYSANPLSYAHNLYLNGKLISDLVIPDGVKSIGNYAFSGCSSLISITIPDSVTSIGGYAFYGCGGLTSIMIPDSVTSIGNYAFSGCSGLTSITIPDGVTSIESSAFSGCGGLTSVTIPDSVTSIGNYAFSGCSSLTSVTIPDSVTSIGNSAFSGCGGLEEVHISNLAAWCAIEFVTKDANPLIYAHNLYLNNILVTDLVIPDDVTRIGSFAFYSCSGLTSVTIPNSVTSIGSFAFYDCSKLTSISIPFVGEKANGSGATHFGYIFGATSYNDNSKYVPSKLKKVIISDLITSIGNSAFYGCNELTSITITNSVTSIGDSAFSGCSGLTSI